MPNISTLYHPEDNRPLKERYQDVNKNEIKFLQKVWVILASKIDRTSRIWTNYSAKSHPNFKKQARPNLDISNRSGLRYGQMKLVPKTSKHCKLAISGEKINGYYRSRVFILEGFLWTS